MRRHSRARLVHASTSSVYGREALGAEDTLPQPVSPYGITKLAAEHLCQAYRESFGLDVVVLRYFSLYGPRQRPDMGYYLFIDALLHDRPIAVYGDGEQTRGNTFVLDVVDANVLAWEKAHSGEVFNIGGGQAVSVNQVLELLQALTGKRARIERRPPRPGDQRHTLADTRRARERLGWVPTTTIEAGLRAQVEWQAAQARRDGRMADRETA
jgi:nucleoside-diphosphate-sugar epimerase